MPLGKRRMIIADIAFDNSYPAGGESLPLRTLGLGSVDAMFINPKSGYLMEYDISNKKVKVFAKAPPIVYEEKHTAVAFTITLDYPAAWIINVTQAGQNMKWGKSQAAASLTGNSFCIVGSMEDGVRTQIFTDGSTDTVFVSYVTQAWAELYSRLVQEEAVTLASGNNDLANKMMAFGFCEASSGILIPVDVDDTTAAGEVGLKMGFATNALNIEATQDGEASVVTYLSEPASGFLTDRFVEKEDGAKAETTPTVNTFDFPLLLWCISGACTVQGENTLRIIETNATAGANEAGINWGKGPADLLAATGVAPTEGFAFGGNDDFQITSGAYLKGYVTELQTVALEVKNGSNLTDLSGVEIIVIGR